MFFTEGFTITNVFGWYNQVMMRSSWPDVFEACNLFILQGRQISQ